MVYHYCIRPIFFFILRVCIILMLVISYRWSRLWTRRSSVDWSLVDWIFLTRSTPSDIHNTDSFLPSKVAKSEEDWKKWRHRSRRGHERVIYRWIGKTFNKCSFHVVLFHTFRSKRELSSRSDDTLKGLIPSVTRGNVQPFKEEY